MRRPFVTSSLFLLFLLTIPFSLLKNQAAVPSLHKGALPGRAITVGERPRLKPLRLSMEDDSLRVDHIIELY